MYAWLEFKQTTIPKYSYVDGKEVHLEIHAGFLLMESFNPQFKGWIYFCSRTLTNDEVVDGNWQVFTPGSGSLRFKTLQEAKNFVEMNL